MKILSNVSRKLVAGISQVVSSFAAYAVRSSQEVELVCVDIERAETSADWAMFQDRSLKGWEKKVFHKPLSEILDSAKNTKDLFSELAPVVESFKDRIKEEHPDLVLVNGTYYLPWCLLRAAKEMQVPVAVHYHGSITKETEHWKEEDRKQLMRLMERDFFSLQNKYIFPSELAQRTVEDEIFLRKMPNALILPNPIPSTFFHVPHQEANSFRRKKNVGVVSRWSAIKNIKFIEKFARLNARRGAYYAINAITDLNRNSKSIGELSEVIHFCLPRKNASLAKFYSRMGAILCPSHFETYGNVAQEAIAAGTPALVSKNMGIAEVLQKIGLQRLIFDFDSPAFVHDQIDEIVSRGISSSERRNLKKEVSASGIYQKMISFLRE